MKEKIENKIYKNVKQPKDLIASLSVQDFIKYNGLKIESNFLCQNSEDLSEKEAMLQMELLVAILNGY